LNYQNEILVDSFAGGGGASQGIYKALGRHVDVAINHNAKALEMHQANHPDTKHYCESVWDVDPRDVHPGRDIGLLWLSPDCKHFSKAKGGKPVEKSVRGLAWIGVRWAAIRQPRIIMLENVEEFKTWGKLNAEGKPCPKNKGREFNAFKNALEKQGYVVEHRELRACDYGAPTIRKRLFLIARRDGEPIIWPEPTHVNPNGPNPHNLPVWKTAADCIDWSIECPSIFERRKPLAENTLRRVAKGIVKYVVEADNPFIVPNLSLVPFISEHANASNQRNMNANEPLRTQCAQVKGGHFSLVSALLAKHYTGAIGSSMDEPVSTITAIDHNSLVTSNLVTMRNNCLGSGADEPISTLTAGGTHHAEVRAFLIKYYGTDQDPELSDPLHTITTKDRFGLVTIKGEIYRIEDIGLRMLQPRELFLAQGFEDSYIIGDDESQGLKLTKEEQVQMVGNSVSPPLACALVKANYFVGEVKIQQVA